MNIDIAVLYVNYSGTVLKNMHLLAGTNCAKTSGL